MVQRSSNKRIEKEIVIVFEISTITEEELFIIQESNDNSCSFFITREWIDFLQNDARGTPVILKIEENRKFVAIFVGMSFRKFGIKLLASPFEQWGTCDMGFCCPESVDRATLIPIVVEYAKKILHIKYFEMIDMRIPFEQLKDLKCKIIPQKTYLLKIDRNNDELFKGFKTDCRNFIRQFEKRGASIEKVSPSEEFANDYYNQLIDVFRKQGLKPNYCREHVYNVMHAFSKNEQNILCLRVKNPEGKCIATSIYFGYQDTAYFWGAASYREYQHYRPNEYMIWTAIQYWRDYGCRKFDLVGLKEYKKKFGPEYFEYPRIIISRNPFLIYGRSLARGIIKFYRKFWK